MDDNITLNDIKQLLQCPTNNCSYMKEIIDAKSKHKYAFMYDCNKIQSIFSALYNTNSIESKPQESLSTKVQMSLQYIIICCIVLISLCILIVSLKYASKSSKHNESLLH